MDNLPHKHIVLCVSVKTATEYLRTGVPKVGIVSKAWISNNSLQDIKGYNYLRML